MHRLRRHLHGILRAAGCLFFAGAVVADAAVPDRPNILFILADDQSYKTLSCYDGAPPWVKTPNIDRLAARGVRFTRSYLGSWCMPARASLLTGRLQHAVQSLTLSGTYPESSYDPAVTPFLPAQLRKHGYHTAQIGKWHVGSDTGYGRDWDHQIVWNRPGKPDNAGAYYQKQIVTINGRDQPAGGYSTDNYTGWAIDYLQGEGREPGKPWFLWLCYGTPHNPATPAERHRGTLAGNRAAAPADMIGPWPDKPAYLERKQAWMLMGDGQPVKARKTRDANNAVSLTPGQSYDAWIQQVNECMASLDEGVGRLLAALEATGQIENTMVVFSADQGFGLGEHGFSDKFAPYDATVASPLIVTWPGVTPAGKVCPHPVNAPDLVDLFSRAAKVDLPWRTHGRDIRPLLTNPEAANWTSSMLMTHTGRSFGAETDVVPTDSRLTAGGGVPWYALLRDGRFKYVRTFVAGETEEIYDLEADPEELVNLATRPEYRARLVALRAKAKAELQRTEAKFVDRMPPTKGER